MNAPEEIVAQLAKLRAPFADHHISKLPKPTKAQTDAVKADFKKGVRCKLCGSWHHPEVVHLDYVGHAAMTDRLLDTDIEWSWEPLAFTENGLPAFDATGGLWIKLTVAGVTRLGYGAADGKSGGDAVKEIIGDALRNAGMRFGAALDLWHKGDLHADSGDGGQSQDGAVSPPAAPPAKPDAICANDLTKIQMLLKATGRPAVSATTWPAWTGIGAPNSRPNGRQARRQSNRPGAPRRTSSPARRGNGANCHDRARPHHPARRCHQRRDCPDAGLVRGG